MCDPHSTNGWHLRKDVTVGQIITIVVVAASLGTVYFDLRGDVQINAVAIGYLDEKVTANERRVSENLKDIKGLLKRIEDKLDRKADR